MPPNPENFYQQQQLKNLSWSNYLMQNYIVGSPNQHVVNLAQQNINHVGFNGVFPVQAGPLAMSYPPSPALYQKQQQEYAKKVNQPMGAMNPVQGGPMLASVVPLPPSLLALHAQDVIDTEAQLAAMGYAPYVPPGGPIPTPQNPVQPGSPIQGLGVPPAPGEPFMQGATTVVPIPLLPRTNYRPGESTWDPTLHFINFANQSFGPGGGVNVQGSANSINTANVSPPRPDLLRAAGTVLAQSMKKMMAGLQKLSASEFSMQQEFAKTATPFAKQMSDIANRMSASNSPEELESLFTQFNEVTRKMFSATGVTEAEGFMQEGISLPGTGMFIRWNIPAQEWTFDNGTAPYDLATGFEKKYKAAKIESDIGAKQKQLDDKTKVSTSLKSLTSQLTDIGDSLDKLQIAQKQYEEKISKSKSASEKLQGEMKTAQNAVDEARTKLTTAQESFANTQKTIKQEEEGFQKKLDAELEQLQKIKMGAASGDPIALLATIKGIRAQIAQTQAKFNASMSGLKAQIDVARVQLELAEAELALIEKRVAQAKTDTETIDGLLQETITNIKKLGQQQADLKNKIAAAGGA